MFKEIANVSVNPSHTKSDCVVGEFKPTLCRRLSSTAQLLKQQSGNPTMQVYITLKLAVSFSICDFVFGICIF